MKLDIGLQLCRYNKIYRHFDAIFKCQFFSVLKSTSSFAIKKSRFDFADELKIGDVRYKHLTQITIKVQLS